MLPKQSLVFQQLFDIWPHIMATGDSKGAIPEKLVFPKLQQNNGCLHLWAQSGGQAMEMTYNKTALIHKINAVFGYALVADIKVTAFPSRTAKKAVTTQAAMQTERGIPCQSLDKIVGGISNPELKTALQELGHYLDPQELNPETTQNDNKGETYA